MLVFLMLLALTVPFLVVLPLRDIIVLPKLAATAAFVGGALLWGAVLLIRDRWPAGRWPPVLWTAVGAFVVVNVLSLLFAADPRSSLWGEYQRYQGLATTLLYVLLFAAAAAAVRTTGDLRWLLLALFFAASGTAIYALIQKADLDWVQWTGRDPDRPGSTVGQANNFGAFLVAAVSACLFLLLSVKEQGVRYQLALTGALVILATGAYGLVLALLDGQQRLVAAFLGGGVLALMLGATAMVWLVRRLRERTLHRALQAALSVALLAMLIALFFTVSRSAYLAAAVAVLLWGVAAVRWFLPRLAERSDRIALTVGAGSVAVAPLVLAVAAVFFVGLPQGRVALTSEANSEAVQGRRTLWQLGLEMALDRPLLGYGQDGFSIQFPAYRDRPDLPGIGTRSIAPESAHNFFVDLASGTGLLGLVAFLALVGSVLWFAVGRAARTEDREVRLAVTALGVAVVAYLVAVFFGFSEAMTTWLFWLLLGALTGLVAERKVAANAPADTGPEVGSVASGLGAVGLTLVGVLALGWAATMSAADLAAGQAGAASGRAEHDAAARLAGRAVSLNPLSQDYLFQKAEAFERAANASVASDKETRLREAIDAYETLGRRFQPAAFDLLSLALVQIQLLQTTQDAPVETAFPLLEEALELDPYNGEFWCFVADKYEELGFDERANSLRAQAYFDHIANCY